jgi:hypothetical protein
MTETELQHFALSILKLAFAGGVLGAICWSLVMRIVADVADAIQDWEDKRTRIGAARARARVRHINGAGLG